MKRFPVLLLLLGVAGCRGGTVGGLSLSVGSYERGLWFDHDHQQYQPNGFGLRLDLVAGKMIRPVPGFWESGNNPWKGDQPWFVLRMPMIGPFLSIAAGRRGAYLGFKTFKVEDRHRTPERYGNWMRPDEFPEPNGVRVYLQPSATVRRTRWK